MFKELQGKVATADHNVFGIGEKHRKILKRILGGVNYSRIFAIGGGLGA
jgi:hypothetical protein